MSVITEMPPSRPLGKGSEKAARTWLIALAFCGLVTFAPTFYSLAVSYTGGDSYYAHWFLIPPVSAFFIWLKKDSLREVPVESCAWGLPLAVGSLLLHVFAVWFRIDFISAFALVVTVWGLVLYFFGRRIVREIIFPLLFLLFMVPLPGTLIAPIAFHMKILSGKVAVRLYNLVGGTALLTGSKISFSHGDPLWMGYECSGLKSVITLSSLGAATAYLVRLSRPRKVLLFLSSFPLAIISNSIRVASLCFAAEQWGVKSREFKIFHDLSSPVVFIMVLIGLFGIYKLLSVGEGASKLQSDAAGEAQPAPSRTRFLRSIPTKKLRITFGLFAVSAILVILSPHFMLLGTTMSSLKPVELPDRIGEWSVSATDAVERAEVFSTLNTKSIVLRDYRDTEGKAVQVLVVASDTDRQAFHPPEICMIGAGNEVMEHWEEPVDINAGETGGLRLNAFVRGTRGRPDTLVLYWYMAGKRSTGNRMLQQLILLLNGARRTPIIGAMIRLTSPLATTSRDETLRRAKDFVRSLVPLMPRILKTARK